MDQVLKFSLPVQYTTPPYISFHIKDM